MLVVGVTGGPGDIPNMGPRDASSGVVGTVMSTAMGAWIGASMKGMGMGKAMGARARPATTCRAGQEPRV